MGFFFKDAFWLLENQSKKTFHFLSFKHLNVNYHLEIALVISDRDILYVSLWIGQTEYTRRKVYSPDYWREFFFEKTIIYLFILQTLKSSNIFNEEKIKKKNNILISRDRDNGLHQNSQDTSIYKLDIWFPASYFENSKTWTFDNSDLFRGPWSS